MREEISNEKMSNDSFAANAYVENSLPLGCELAAFT